MQHYRPSEVRRRSRLSLHPKGRESIFAGNPEQHRGDGLSFYPSLRECVRALEDCCEEVCYIWPIADNTFLLRVI
jgi:hypothetical protein